MKKENQNNQKPNETTNESKSTVVDPKKRQIILETDGNVIQLIKAEVAGNIELIAILSSMLEALKKQ